MTGKTAQARFNKLVDRHHRRDRKELFASGVEEAYEQQKELLVKLTSRLDEHADSEKAPSDKEKAKNERLASAGEIVLAEALSRMKRSADDQPEGRDAACSRSF